MKCVKGLTLDISLAANKMELFNRSKQSLSSSLQETLLDAKHDQRLTCGIYESAQLLQMSPESIMLCVLPEDKSDDLAVQIHFTLIRAFCLENDIAVVKVDSTAKIKTILADKNASDYNCILVEFPMKRSLSSAEENLLDFGYATGDVSPLPVLSLEV
jgi:growth arrest and DNA-damage-inducible protein